MSWTVIKRMQPRPRKSTAEIGLPWKKESPLPDKPGAEFCPRCHGEPGTGFPGRATQPTALPKIPEAIARILGAMFILVFSVFRLVRLVVAFGFSLVGQIGFGLQHVANRIVHPDDRRLLPGKRGVSPSR